MKKYIFKVKGNEVSKFEALNSKHFTCVELVKSYGSTTWDYNGHYENYIPRDAR